MLYALVITILVIFIAVVINHTQKLVHEYNSRSTTGTEALTSGGRGGGGSSGGGSGFGSGGSGQRLSSTPIIHLWEPPHAHT